MSLAHYDLPFLKSFLAIYLHIYVFNKISNCKHVAGFHWACWRDCPVSCRERRIKVWTQVVFYLQKATKANVKYC